MCEAGYGIPQLFVCFAFLGRGAQEVCMAGYAMGVNVCCGEKFASEGQDTHARVRVGHFLLKKSGGHNHRAKCLASSGF